jgi:hypothetical protein
LCDVYIYIAPLISEFSTGEDISSIYEERKFGLDILDVSEAAVLRNRNIYVKSFRLFVFRRKENNLHTVDD